MTTTAPIPEIDPATSTDAAALGRAAFNRIAARDFDGARPLLERAMSLQPRDIMLAHIKAHLTSDSGAYEEGATFLRAFLAQDEGTLAAHPMHTHTCWHLAEIELELGNAAAALELHERYVGPRVAQLPITFYSAVTLLWRLELIGFGRAQGRQVPWRQLHDARATILSTPPKPGAMANPPALDHIAHGMTSIATGDDATLASLLDSLRSTGPDADPVFAEVVVPVIRGLHAFWHAHYRAAINHIQATAASFGRLTKFPDQLRVLELTLHEARRRAESDSSTP